MFSFLPLALSNDVLLRVYSEGRGQESGCAEKGRGLDMQRGGGMVGI